MASRTPLDLFNVLWDLLSAPARIVAPHFPAKGGEQSADRSAVRAALKKIMIGQEGKAVKLLLSNGVAEATPEVVKALRELHPPRSEELVLPQVKTPQADVDSDDIFNKLYAKSEGETVSNDAFGWSYALLFPCRAAPRGAMAAIAKFLGLFAREPQLFPHPCAELLATGILTPLQKLSKGERRMCEQAGAEPKIRPINAGTLFAKTLLSRLLDTPEAKEAARN